MMSSDDQRAQEALERAKKASEQENNRARGRARDADLGGKGK